MINYKSDIAHCGSLVLFLQRFENDFQQYMKKLKSEDNFQQLHIELSLSLVDCKYDEPPVSVSGNACFSIKSSNSFVGRVEDYIRKRDKEFKAVFPANKQLQIVLKFSTDEKKNISNNDKELTFIPVRPKYAFDQVILPEKLKTEIEESLNIIQYQNLIYKVWGFEKVDPVPKSVLNFYGPPGTGKTMCAHAIANKLDKKLLALNYAEIESKYVGEAPKNLMKAFDTARQEDCVLFFDEADSFLGKRIQNVTQGADQALNSLRSQMLILLEEYSGIVIFATNLVSNFDKAFESRILKHLKFELPNKEARIQIIKSMLPEALPVSRPFVESEFEEFGEETEGLAGREIKNAILDALVSKASKDKELSVFNIQDFKSAFAHRKDMLESLKKEANEIKRQKIIDAINRKNAENKVDKDNQNEHSEEEQTINDKKLNDNANK